MKRKEWVCDVHNASVMGWFGHAERRETACVSDGNRGIWPSDCGAQIGTCLSGNGPACGCWGLLGHKKRLEIEDSLGPMVLGYNINCRHRQVSTMYSVLSKVFFNLTFCILLLSINLANLHWPLFLSLLAVPFHFYS